jgi:hypothetical protein
MAWVNFSKWGERVSLLSKDKEMIKHIKLNPSETAKMIYGEMGRILRAG